MNRRNIIRDIRDNSKLSLLLIIAAIIVFFAAIYFTLNYFEMRGNVYEEADGGGFARKMPDVTYNGIHYRYKSRVKNILVLGVDSSDDIESGTGTGGGKQADAIYLISVDHNNKEINYIQFDRDIMTSVTRYDTEGNFYDKGTYQLTLAYAYGAEGKGRSENVAESVSNLLYGVPVDEYYALNMEAIPIINDALGGVPVTIEDDFSGIDPTLVMGETVTLMGEHAINFVRTRRGIGSGYNVDRMRRQRAYLDSLKEVFKAKIEDDPQIAIQIDEDIDDYRYSSMDAVKVAELLLEAEDYTSNDIVALSGEADYSGRYAEVTPNDEEIMELVMNTFYEEKPE